MQIEIKGLGNKRIILSPSDNHNQIKILISDFTNLPPVRIVETSVFADELKHGVESLFKITRKKK